jgi:ferredoxin
MAAINPEFREKLKKYGAFDFIACYNCGNCTAVCSLSTEENSFPREMLRLSTLGLEGEIKSSLKPWLCYYCGDCSTHCPQTANPAELMMSLRRWLTSEYDWTKLSGLLYRSLSLTLLVFLLLAAVVAGVSAYSNASLETIMHVGHTFEFWAIVGVFGVILLPNIIRMWWFIILKPKVKVPFVAYLTSFGALIVHMFTQKRSLGCDDNQFRWLEHLVLVVGYLALLFTSVVLDWFATESIFVIVLGYAESLVIFIVTIDFVYNRIKKTREVSKFSQPSDWFFIIWLFLMGFTAFVVRVMIDTHLLETNSWIYLVHFIILVQWALIIVPFGKWTHFLYRSFAMYFEKLRVAGMNSL